MTTFFKNKGLDGSGSDRLIGNHCGSGLATLDMHSQIYCTWYYRRSKHIYDTWAVKKLPVNRNGTETGVYFSVLVAGTYANYQHIFLPW